MKVLILGGSRFVGPLLIEKLLAHNHDVTVFNRGLIKSDYSDAVTFIKGDRSSDLGQVTLHFDVVVDMCAYTGDQTQKALDELSCDFFVHFGTVSSYRYSEVFPLTEESSTGIWPLMGDYGKGKVECEKVLAAAGKKYATIRPTYILGPGNYIDRENFIYSRINSGKTITLPGNGQALTQYVFADDVADIIVLLSEKQIGGAFNCVGDELITNKGLVDLMASIAGKKAIIDYNPSADGANHIESEFPFANENLVCSNQKIKDLGFSFLPLLDGLKMNFESYYKKQL